MKKTRIMASAMALVMCATAMPMAAFATEGVIEEKQATVDVILSVDSSYEVKIPKTINMSKETKTADYTVSVSGNISGKQYIEVIPDASFLMSQDGKDDITATVTQEKQSVASAEIEDSAVVTLSGSISAPDATAGSWSGSLNFNIGFMEQQ